MWHAAITNLALTSDGQEMIHEISRPYPGYSYAETQKKFENAVKANKPHTCKYIQEHLGFRCGRDCGVRAPIALLRKVQRGPVLWETPIPFDEISLPDFPVDALPDAIADYVNAVAESTQTPPDMAATAALAIVALTMQGKYKVRGKDDWVEPVNLYAVNVAEPAERKKRSQAAASGGCHQPDDPFHERIRSRIQQADVRKVGSEPDGQAGAGTQKGRHH